MPGLLLTVDDITILLELGILKISSWFEKWFHVRLESFDELAQTKLVSLSFSRSTVHRELCPELLEESYYPDRLAQVVVEVRKSICDHARLLERILAYAHTRCPPEL